MTTLRFGWPANLWREGVDAEIVAGLDQTADWLERAGATRVPMEFLPGEYSVATYYLVATAEASSNLARFDGVRYGLRVEADSDLRAMYELTRAQGFGAEVKRRIMLGTYALSSGYYEAYYGRAQKVRTKISEDFRSVFERFDFVVTPTSPTFCEKLVYGNVLKMPPISVPRPSVRRPRARSSWSSGLPVMSDSARNMPVDSIITTIITSVMVRIMTGSNVGMPNAKGVTTSNHAALPTLSKLILPIATATTQPAMMPSSTATLETKPRP